MKPLAVALGGAAGSVLRYLLSVALAAPSLAFPINTLVVNVVGSFVLGAVLTALPTPTSTLRLLLATGLCGGFTTFSTFSSEIVTLAQRGAVARAATYAAASLFLGVVAVLAGVVATRAVLGAR